MKHFIWAFLLLLSCGVGVPKQNICGIALDKWHECGHKCYEIFYYIDVQTDRGEEILIVDKSTYGKTQIGEKVCY